MQVSPVCFDASTDEGIDFLVKKMYERVFAQQGVVSCGLVITELTFWNVSNTDQKIRFHLKTRRRCHWCNGCYSVHELKGERIVSRTTSCRWLRDPKEVQIQELQRE
jgi:hypothetical protein